VWGDDDVEPLLDEMLRQLGDGTSLRAFTTHDAEATLKLTVVGEFVLDLVATPDEASRRRIYVDDDFEPLLDGDRVALVFGSAVLRFLATAGASLDTHIDFDLGAPR
jgi:hypothetical protein